MSNPQVVLLEREYYLSRDSELRVFIPCDAGTLDALTVSLLQKDAVDTSNGLLFQSRADKEYLSKLTEELGEKFNPNSCELNGSELLPNTVYSFGDFGTLNGGTSTHTRSFGLYTNTGCTVRLKGPPKILHEIYTTDAVIHRRNILNIHHYLNDKRRLAKKKESDAFGPRVLVIGAESTGKTTVAHSLVNYASRLGYHPYLLDLSNAIQTREAAELYCVKSPFDPSEGTTLVPKLSYFFGSTDPCSNFTLLKHTVSCMLEQIYQRAGRDKRAQIGGFVFDCPAISVSDETAAAQSTTGSTVDPGLDFLYHVIAEAHIDVVVTCGGDRLRNQLRKHCAVVSYTARGGSMTGPPNQAATPAVDGDAMPTSFLEEMGGGEAPAVQDRDKYFDDFVGQNPTGFQLFDDHVLQLIALETPGGCTSWFKEERKALSLNYWRRYFLGSGNRHFRDAALSHNPAAPGLALVPHPIELNWDTLEPRFVQLQAVSASSLAGLLPMDYDESKTSSTTVSYVNEMEYAALLPGRVVMLASTTTLDGVTGKPRLDPATGMPIDVDEELQKGLGVGYLWIVSVNESQKKIKVLSPNPDLPNDKRGLCFYVCDTVLTKKTLLGSAQ